MNSNQQKEVELTQLDAALLQAVDSMAQGLARAANLNRRTCLHCDYFEEGQEVCLRAKPPMRPPARVLAFGCPGFENDIPF